MSKIQKRVNKILKILKNQRSLSGKLPEFEFSADYDTAYSLIFDPHGIFENTTFLNPVYLSRLDDEEVKAVLCHEIGHHHLFTSNEFECDQFSVLQCHVKPEACISSLRKGIRMFKFSKADLKFVNKRISNLENLVVGS